MRIAYSNSQVDGACVLADVMLVLLWCFAKPAYSHEKWTEQVLWTAGESLLRLHHVLAYTSSILAS